MITASTEKRPAYAPKPQPVVAIVDDDAAVCEAIQLLIESYGWVVQAYDSAEKFLDSLERERPVCLVLDLLMPGMNGVQLQQALASREINIPIVVVTVYGNHKLAGEAVKAGAQTVLVKPFNHQELLENIKQAAALACW